MNIPIQKNIQQPQPQSQPQHQPQEQINEIKLKIKQKPVEPWVIQDIIQNNHLHPTKDWNDQFYQDLHRTILNAEMKDTKALGSVVGVAVVGLLGFALSFTVIGFVVGSILGVIMGGYAGKRIKRKNSKFKSLIHFDLFMINVACYYGVLYDEIIRNKGTIQLNNFRFKIQKCLQEYRGVEIFSKLSDSRQKGFRSEMIRLMKLLQCQEAFKSMYLIYKLTKTIMKKTEKCRTDIQEYEIQVMLITVIKPLVTIMQICDSKLNYDQKYLLQKLEKLAFSYESLLLYDKLPENLLLNQKEFLKKMDQKVNVEELKNNFKAFDLDKMVLENQQNNQQNPKKQLKLIDLIQEQYEQAEKISQNNQSAISSQKQLENESESQQQKQQLKKKKSDDSISCSSIDSDEIYNSQIEELNDSKQKSAKKQEQEIENIVFNNPNEDKSINKINNNNFNNNHQRININMNYSNPKNSSIQFRNTHNKKKTLNPTFVKPQQIDQHNDSFIPADLGSNFSSKKASNRQHISNSQQDVQNNINEMENQNQNDQTDDINQDQIKNNKNENGNNKIEKNQDNQIIRIQDCPVEAYENPNSNQNIQNNQDYNQFDNNYNSQSKDFLIQNKNRSNDYQQSNNNNDNANLNQVEITIENNTIKEDKNKQSENNSSNININNDNNNNQSEIQQVQEEAVDAVIQQQDSDIIEKTSFLMNIYDETIEQGKWKSVINKKDMEIYKKTNLESAAVMIRCHCYLKDSTAKEIFNCIYDAKDRGSWDKLLLGFTRVEQLNDYTDIIYSYVDPGFGVTKREWVQKRFYKFDYPNPGQITICYYSVEHPLYPKKKGYIRADSYIAGYIMENVGNDCKLFILSCNDIKGLIPKYIVNFMAARAPKDWINSLHKYIQKRRDEQQKAIKNQKK